MLNVMKRFLALLTVVVAIGGGVMVAVVQATNSPFGVSRGVNGTFAIVSCSSGSTSVPCSDHWVIGTGSEDPPTGYGNEGDLFWRTDLKAFRTKTSGSWASASGTFPISATSGLKSVTEVADATVPSLTTTVTDGAGFSTTELALSTSWTQTLVFGATTTTIQLHNGGFSPPLKAFANLGSTGPGTILYCSDCTITNPCAGAGTGAIAKRLNGIWVCN